ncbi:MAG: hypothetical protein WCI22_07135 [Actinomycetota bacterium]
MPSRRHKSSPSSPSSKPAPAAANVATAPAKDAAAMFSAALKESELRDRAAREHKAKDDAVRAQRQAELAAHATSLADARRDLDRAIEAVRAAKRNGKSTVEADAVWKVAKARVIELETGTPPVWAPAPVSAVDDSPVDDSPVDDSPVDDSPVDDGAVAEEQS